MDKAQDYARGHWPQNYTRVNAAIRPDQFLRDNLPGGKFGNGDHGRYYSACNPSRGEKNPSLTVWLADGNYKDHASGDSGGDWIALYAYLTGKQQSEAMTALAEQYGAAIENRDPPKPAKPKPSRPKKHSREGAASDTWEYTDRTGKPIFWVYRFDKADGGKSFRPLHYSGKAWEWKDPPGKLPLYHLDRIAATPGAPLLFCEGEKAADAAAAYFPQHVTTSTAHGAQSPGKSDFSPVKGLPCLILPDNDKPGAAYADKLAALLHQAGASIVEIIQWPEGYPEKSDAADFEKLGITPEQVQQWPKRAYKPPEDELIATHARLSVMSNTALATLAKRNTPATLFVQQGRLVRLTLARDANGGHSINLVSVDALVLKHELERAIEWKRYDRHGELRNAPPPDMVCADILAMPDYEQFPRLARVVTAPCVSASGHVIDKPGFDAASGIFYHQSEPLNIPDTTPTQESVKAAVSFILDTWLADFPFDMDCPPPEGETPTASSSKAHALAMFLLPFARPLIDGVTPLHFITAPAQRTGKSLLVEVVAGVFDPLVSPGAGPEGRDNDAEWRKKITAALQNEGAFLWIDNIKGMVDTGALEAALTSAFWSDRALGSHKQVTLKNDKVWAFTGNNAELSQDLFGRAVEIRLDANIETPSERQDFKIKDIRRWTRQHRGELCAAALVLIRNWLEGRPEPADGTPYMGGFEAWRRVMGGILTAAGVPGFLMNRQITRERVNGQDDIFKSFVETWAEEFGTDKTPLSAKDLRDIASGVGLFDEVLFAKNEQGKIRKLGRWLSKNTDRVLAGYKIQTGKTPAKGNKGYFLQSLSDKNGLSGKFQNLSQPTYRETRETREASKNAGSLITLETLELGATGTGNVSESGGKPVFPGQSSYDADGEWEVI